MNRKITSLFRNILIILYIFSLLIYAALKVYTGYWANTITDIKYIQRAIGTVIFIIVPVIVVLLCIFVKAVDYLIDNKKHRKKILRKRNRRRNRYKREGIYGDMRPAV